MVHSKPGDDALRARVPKAKGLSLNSGRPPQWTSSVGLFTAFAGLGGTASVIPAIIPLTAHNSNASLSEYLGVAPALFFGLMAGVLLSAILLRATSARAVLCAGSVLQAAALIAIALAPDRSAFGMSASAAGVGFGLCEASGSVLARVVAGDRAARLLSALTGTGALVAAAGPLFIVSGILGASPAPLLASTALVHVATVLFQFLGPKQHLGEHADRGIRTRAPAPAPSISWVLLLAPVAAALFIYVGIETIFAGWSAVIAAEALALDPRTAAAGTSVFWVLMAAGRYAAWFTLKSSVTPSALLAFTCTLAAVCFAGAGILRQEQPAVALVATGVAIAGLGPTYSLVLGIGLSRIEVHDAKKAVGLLVACGAAGGAGIPAALLTVTPHPGAPWVLVTSALLTALIAPLIFHKTPRPPERPAENKARQ